MKAWLCCQEFKTAFRKILGGWEQHQNDLDQISGLVKGNGKLNKNVNLFSFRARKNFLVPKAQS
jgi:hypothetical protein